MPISALGYLHHIHDELCYLLDSSAALSAEQFAASPTYQRAFARSFEIIGEATKQLDQSLRDHYPTVPWGQMAKMRDKLIHHYFSVDYELIWITVLEDLPALRHSIGDIIEAETRREMLEKQNHP